MFLRLILFTEAFKNCVGPEALSRKGCSATITKFFEKYLSKSKFQVKLAHVFEVLPCLQVSSTVRCFLSGWVGLKNVSCGNFGMNVLYKFTKCHQSAMFTSYHSLVNLSVLWWGGLHFLKIKK